MYCEYRRYRCGEHCRQLQSVCLPLANHSTVVHRLDYLGVSPCGLQHVHVCAPRVAAGASSNVRLLPTLMLTAALQRVCHAVLEKND